MAKRWYVVHTYSGAEKRVKELLIGKIREIDNKDDFGEILVPEETTVELKGGEKAESKKKTFPGYVLVEMEMNPNNWRIVKDLPKVTGFIGGVDAVPISEADVAAMKALAQSDAVRSATKYMKGDLVEVVDGPFSGFKGSIEEVNPEKEKVCVIVSIFGRQTPVELDYLQVKRAGK